MLKIKLSNLSLPQAEVGLEEQKVTRGGTCAVGENGLPIGNCVDYGDFYRNLFDSNSYYEQQQQNLSWYDSWYNDRRYFI